MLRLRAARRPSVLATIVVAGSVTLSSCAAFPAPAPAARTTEASPAPSTSSAAPVALLPGGTAADNLPYFASIVNATAGSGAVTGRSYIDALVAAGFDRSAMQVTPDVTTIGEAAESVEFSVRWGGDCLLGQFGPAVGGPTTVVLPGLPDGGCLVGTTRAIDW